jgi:CRP-like cAMP-binding protein
VAADQNALLGILSGGGAGGGAAESNSYEQVFGPTITLNNVNFFFFTMTNFLIFSQRTNYFDDDSFFGTIDSIIGQELIRRSVDQFFGEFAMVTDDQPRSANVTALTHVKLVTINKKDYGT